MVGSRRWAIKKFLRGYAVTIVTSALLILILALLILARLGDLYSVRYVSKINPLITSGQNELIAAKDKREKTASDDDQGITGLSKVTKDSQGSNSGQSDSPGSSSSSGQGGSGDSSTGTSSGGNTGNSGGNTGSGTTGGGGGGSSPAPQAFTASISYVGQPAPPISVNLGSTCKTSHTFSATITAANAPGTVSYRWKQSNGVTSSTQQVSFLAGETSKTVTANQWDISGPTATYSMTFELLSPAYQQQTVSFQHSCPTIGL